MSFKVPFALLCSAFLALPGLLAAAPLRFLPWDDATAGRKLAVLAGTSQVELKGLHPHKRSDVVNVSGTAEVPPQLVATDKTGADGKPVTAEIKIPADCERPLVLIMPDTKHPTGLRTFVIEDSAGRFPWGTLRLINATGKPLMTQIEKTVTQLPASWNPVDIKPGGETRNVGVQTAAKDNPKTILYSAVWEHDPDLRKLVFILPAADPKNPGLQYKIIPENRKVVALEEAEAKNRQP
jgi:hypothetical protein